MAIGGYTDPREGVNLGQADTGQAVVLGGYHDPLEEAKGVAFRQKAETDRLAAEKKAADDAQKKELLGLVPKVEYFMNSDRDLMKQNFNQVLSYIGALGQEGRAERLSDPSSQERIQYEQIMAGNNAYAKKSQNDLAWWEGFYKQLQDNPDNFTPDAIKAAYDWASKPYTTRGEPPQLEKYFDEVAHQNKVAERLKEMEMTSGAGFADDGRTIAEYTKSYISPERAQDSAIASYEADPRQKKRVDERYNSLPPDQKDALLSEGIAVNARRKAAGLPPLTPQQYLHYNEAWKAREVTQQQVKKEQVSEGNYGIGEKRSGADYWLKATEGLGKKTLMYSPTNISVPVSSGGYGQPATVANVDASKFMVGKPVGKNPFVFGKTYAYVDPATNETKLFQTVLPGANLSSKGNEKYKEWYDNAIAPLLDDQGNLRPEAASKVRWMNQDELFAGVIVPAAEGLGEASLPAMTKIMDEKGIPYEEGKVDLNLLGGAQWPEASTKTLPTWGSVQKGTTPATPPPSTGKKTIPGF